MNPCIECGNLTEWVMRLDVPRKTDPPMPFAYCHLCLKYGLFRRRNWTRWVEDVDA